MDLLKLFSAMSTLFDKPPQVNPKKKQEETKKTNADKVSHFLSAHDRLSQKIKENNKNKT